VKLLRRRSRTNGSAANAGPADRPIAPRRQSNRRDLICLANSIKLGNRCFAGIDVETDEWVRPIGSGDHGAVTYSDQRLEDGALAKLLDIVSVPLGEPRPIPGQPENWRVGRGPWRRVGSINQGEARQLLDRLATVEPLFGTRFKAVPTAFVSSGRVTASLAIVRPKTVSWRYEGVNRLYAEFEHAGEELSLKVTDPTFTELFRGDTPDTYGFEDDGEVTTYLTVSLPEAWNGAHWKLVAAVMRL
jgi:hypothetical protein